MERLAGCLHPNHPNGEGSTLIAIFVSPMALRDVIRKYTPDSLLRAYRRRKKVRVNKVLAAQKRRGEGHSQETLIKQLREMGIVEGDTIMVHTSMSKMGYVQDGPRGVIEALQEVVGTTGNVCMPSSPNPALQLKFVQDSPIFDRANSPSKMGAITEIFRTTSGVLRSFHPTEPVCAAGPDAEWLTNGHFGEETPYTKSSPFYRVMEKRGKILYVGVTLINAGTNLHTLEDAVDFKYPVYTEKKFRVKMIDTDGSSSEMETRVHNPVMSARRRCDELLPRFEQEGALSIHQLGSAPVLLFDAWRMFEVMVSAYEKEGVTMYTPNGEELSL